MDLTSDWFGPSELKKYSAEYFIYSATSTPLLYKIEQQPRVKNVTMTWMFAKDPFQNMLSWEMASLFRQIRPLNRYADRRFTNDLRFNMNQ